jgi:GT2 family glycosyltransferase
MTQAPVVIVVPVYRDPAVTRRCLDALAASALPAGASVLLVDDHSPERAVRDCCREFSERHGFTLLRNDENLGFVRTANRGFEYQPTADVILLNSDTVVNGNWVTRLRDCAYRDVSIGTVTPFSNNGTICSYPVFLESSDLPTGWSAAAMDAAFAEVNAGQSAEIPTAVGFCVYIKRDCLRETGPFDEEQFGRGYGEECDFSLRAAARGWKHVVAGDVFVFHEGGASFAGESDARKRQADDVIERLHPDYHDRVMDFVLADPLAPLREAVDARRLREWSPAAAEMVGEQRRRLAALLQTTRDYRDEYREHRARYEEALVVIEDWKARLAECRQRFEEVDRALAEAGSVVDHYKGAVEELRAGISNEQAYSATLRECIDNMENSRSWRYTAWLRRK